MSRVWCKATSPKNKKGEKLHIYSTNPDGTLKRVPICHQLGDTNIVEATQKDIDTIGLCNVCLNYIGKTEDDFGSITFDTPILHHRHDPAKPGITKCKHLHCGGSVVREDLYTRRCILCGRIEI